MSSLKHVKNRLESFENALRAIEEAQRWRKHETTVGRNKTTTKRLRVNVGAETFQYNIQYSEGGRNYWNMPEDMRVAMVAVIRENSKFLFDEAEKLLRERALEKGQYAEELVGDFESALAEMKNGLAEDSSGE